MYQSFPSFKSIFILYSQTEFSIFNQIQPNLASSLDHSSDALFSYSPPEQYNNFFYFAKILINFEPIGDVIGKDSVTQRGVWRRTSRGLRRAIKKRLKFSCTIYWLFCCYRIEAMTLLVDQEASHKQFITRLPIPIIQSSILLACIDKSTIKTRKLLVMVSGELN